MSKPNAWDLRDLDAEVPLWEISHDQKMFDLWKEEGHKQVLPTEQEQAVLPLGMQGMREEGLQEVL
jgi:hypothetical protein